MDLMKTEYEFLDLSDVKEADLSSLQCALFEEKPGRLATAVTAAWGQPSIDVSSCSSSSRGPSTVSSSVESVGGGEGEMSPQSPARGGQSAGPPPPYAPPPPAYPPPQWPVAPPNVYVSQVTANVNVHGYMGQYYQPQPQYAPPPEQRPQRTHRRERRGKRVPSPPPPQPPPYYVQYPQYYPAQAQGAPLYHLPVYQPMIYGPYAYPTFYPEYPMAAEGDDKPEEYPTEALMEQEAVDAYYAGAHYGPPHYQPDAPLEYVPPVYLPPPPAPLPPPPTHQFNVHAKNFVQSQPQPKPYIPQEKITERRTPPVAVSATASISVDSLPLKDLKIATRGPGSPKQIAQAADRSKVASPAEKLSPTTRTDPAKPAWVSSEVKAPEAVSQAINAAKTFPPIASANVQVPGAAKLPPSLGPQPKSAKGPTAPFAGTKQPPKPTVTQATVPVQIAASTPKAPFGNRQKRDGPMNRSPSSETAEGSERSAPVVEHVKREPPLPPSKAPMPISITLHAQGQPLIVTNKSPFAHSRKASTTVETPPAPQPPPPAPTASDFPPPPTPRNRVEPPPPVTPQPQPQTAPGKSWASLFSNKSAAPAPAPVAPVPAPVEEPASPTATCAPTANIQKPVAKVPPYDASPLQAVTEPKQPVAPRPAPVPTPVITAPASLSYSEKTSANASSSSVASVKPASPVAVSSVPENKDTPPPPLPQPSPFADDPNSYRMGEFLSKYQIDNRPVSLVPRGLTNRSNYCYVNAILQALIACPPFYNMLKALPYQTRRGKSSTPVIDSMVELCYEFTPVSTASRASRAAGSLGVPAGPPLDGGAGLRVLRALRPFAGSQDARQEDAEEFLGCLLNSLNDEMLELMKLVEPEEAKEAQVNGVITQEQPQADEDDDDDEWKVMGPRNRGAVERRWVARRTPVADVFRGRTRLRLHRSHDDLTDAVHPFFTLQLDMERANSVKDALELVANKDALEGVSDAWQQLAIEQLPVVLLLHLKCFQLDTDGHTAKILKNIDFPIDLKIDPKIMSSKNKYTSKQRMYKLFAVVYHEGVEATKGHYLTDAFHGQAGWIRYDDSTVTNLVSDVQVLKPKPPRMPYLLMYRRHDTLPVHRPAAKE